MNLILFFVVGLIAGWIAGIIMKGRGFGLLGKYTACFPARRLRRWELYRGDPVDPPQGGIP